MRTSETLFTLVGRLREAGLDDDAALLEAEARRVGTIEALVAAVLEATPQATAPEPISFPARRLRQYVAMAQAGD